MNTFTTSEGIALGIIGVSIVAAFFIVRYAVRMWQKGSRR